MSVTPAHRFRKATTPDGEPDARRRQKSEHGIDSDHGGRGHRVRLRRPVVARILAKQSAAVQLRELSAEQPIHQPAIQTRRSLRPPPGLIIKRRSFPDFVTIRFRLLLPVLGAALLPAIRVGARHYQDRGKEVDATILGWAATARSIASNLDTKIQATTQLHFGLSRARDLGGRDKDAYSRHARELSTFGDLATRLG